VISFRSTASPSIGVRRHADRTTEAGRQVPPPFPPTPTALRGEDDDKHSNDPDRAALAVGLSPALALAGPTLTWLRGWGPRVGLSLSPTSSLRRPSGLWQLRRACPLSTKRGVGLRRSRVALHVNAEAAYRFRSTGMSGLPTSAAAWEPTSSASTSAAILTRRPTWVSICSGESRRDSQAETASSSRQVQRERRAGRQGHGRMDILSLAARRMASAESAPLPSSRRLGGDTCSGQLPWFSSYSGCSVFSRLSPCTADPMNDHTSDAPCMVKDVRRPSSQSTTRTTAIVQSMCHLLGDARMERRAFRRRPSAARLVIECPSDRDLGVRHVVHAELALDEEAVSAESPFSIPPSRLTPRSVSESVWPPMSTRLMLAPRPPPR